MTKEFELKTTCPHCGKENEVTSSLAEFDDKPRKPRAAEDGDFGFCLGCGEWHVFEAASPNGVRVPTPDEYMTIGTNPTMRKVRAAFVAAQEAAKKPKEPPKPVPGTRGREAARGHFKREFDRIRLMGGRGNMPPAMHAAIKGIYAVAILDVFEQIDRARGMGLSEGTAYLAQLQKEAREFADEAGQEALKHGSMKP